MMEKKSFKVIQSNSYLSASNAAYLEDLYERYLENPQSVDEPWRLYFDGLPSASKPDLAHGPVREQFISLARQQGREKAGDAVLERKQAQVTQLIEAYRLYGHYHASLDPLKLADHLPVPELDPAYYGLSQTDSQTLFNAESFNGFTQSSLQNIHAALLKTYCGNLGFEYMHIADAKQTRWLQQRIEQPRKPFSQEDKRHILEQLTAAEGLERYLGSKYVGQKRFSLEGTDSLIPLLDTLIQQAAAEHVADVVIGMAHRGRLNVLVNIVGKSPAQLFEEFEGKHNHQTRSGDVKYHSGFSSDVKTPQGPIHLSLAFNPSHLEIIAPVVEGSVRARQDRQGSKSQQRVVPIILHGDAAFAGQGVVMETLNFSQTRGFSTGGTIHIVVNNQVGFTTSDQRDSRSTPYCTDVAKMVQAPIFHVNADDPEAVIFAAQLAFDFRMTFNKDVVIDLVGYRRQGHNEADEPAATQPTMYRIIKQRPTVRALYAEQLEKEGVLAAADADALVSQYRDTLDAGRGIVTTIATGSETSIVDWTPFLDQPWTAPANTGLPIKQLQDLTQSLESLPEGMVLQPQVARMMEDRRNMTAGKTPLNWGYAETLAYASLVTSGYAVRLCGQDSGRGTFAHRHAALHDYNTGETYIPLQHLSQEQASFTVIDSILSEEAVVGFEYGYACTSPQTLVLWEAQFGDFANGAQVVIDQFISSGEQKWGRLCGLVMLLPHGYEGMGPEHSSARLERYLQLCAQHNMQVCVPSTPAQIFHLLRRQMLRPFRKPLIVMTPKSLLRHKQAVSSITDLSEGKFYNVIAEIEDIKPASVRRVIFCSGRIYYELLEARHATKREDIAIIRIEQLYPFPQDDVMHELKQYKKANEVVWCQEEPMNQGAWYQIQHRLRACLIDKQTLQYAGRSASASTAAGYASLHQEEQSALIKSALG
jgi:2-oxoglutarate dehydrogenase E1 component